MSLSSIYESSYFKILRNVIYRYKYLNKCFCVSIFITRHFFKRMQKSFGFSAPSVESLKK